MRGTCKNLCLGKYLREPVKEELYIDNLVNIGKKVWIVVGSISQTRNPAPFSV